MSIGTETGQTVMCSLTSQNEDTVPVSGAATEFVTCLQCGGDDFDTLLGPEKLGSLDYCVVRCRACELVYTNPRPDEQAMARHYGPQYGPHAVRARRGGWFAALRNRLENATMRSYFGYPPQPVSRVTKLAGWLGSALIRRKRCRAAWIQFRGSGRLLDFGCGAGSFLGRMQRFGWSVEGVEACAEVAARVHEATGIRIHIGSLPHADLRPSSFDMVTMWSSLEHVHDPRQVVGAVYDLLRPGGRLLVYVPNLASWAFRTFQHAWYGLDIPRHLTHFAGESLSRLLCSEGFRVCSLTHIGRDGWLRETARRARRLGTGPHWTTALTWKQVARCVSWWTERTAQADSILVLAERE